MRIGAFEIKSSISVKGSWIWRKILAAGVVAFFIAGMIQTHGMLSYRNSYANLIPQQSQLVPYGPVYMSAHAAKNGPVVEFYGQNGRVIFSEKTFSIPMDSVLNLAGKYKGSPVAILWIYKGNPSRLVWKIYVNNEEVLDLKDSISEYEVHDSFGYGSLWMSLVFAIWFMASLFEINRVK